MITSSQQILTDAAALIEQRGWGQGSEGTAAATEGGALCANLALGKAAFQGEVLGSNYRSYLGAQVALLKHIHVDIGPTLLQTLTKGTLIVEWNDAPERTQQEVVDALRGAANAVAVEALTLAGLDEVGHLNKIAGARLGDSQA